MNLCFDDRGRPGTVVAAIKRGVSSNQTENWNKIVRQRVFPELVWPNQSDLTQSCPNSTYQRAYTLGHQTAIGHVAFSLSRFF